MGVVEFSGRTRVAFKNAIGSWGMGEESVSWMIVGFKARSS